MALSSPAAVAPHWLKETRLWREACYIGGAWSGEGGARIAVDDPATGEILGHVPRYGAAETRRAIEAAARALPAWRARTAQDRARLLRKWFDLMMAHQEDLAVLMTREQGKPLSESRGEVAYAASFLEWLGEEGKRAYGETIPTYQRDRRVLVVKEPVGVAACITPWNFPSAMITRKAGAALAAGCTTVIKPASQTPFSALALAELSEQAGIPAGVINVVTGSATEIGAELTGNPLVRKLSFTGSTEVGRILMAQCAPNIKRLSLELGGNAPFIVFADADLDAAVEGALAAKFRNSGQTCICANRILVQAPVYDAFAQRLVQAVGRLQPAPGTENGSTQGPLIDDLAVQRVEAHVADAIARGARLLSGGKRHARGGRFFEPTVLAEATPAMRIAHEETFGPVAPLFRFSTEAEAIALANDTPYGLAAYFYGRDPSRIWRVAEALEYGMVGINTGTVSTAVAPFGGMKESGLGREGSRYGLDEYLETKYLCWGGLSAQ